jgi:hypothetical protein
MYAELALPEALQVLHDQGWTSFEASTEHLVQIETGEDPGAQIAQVRERLAELSL